MTKEKFLAIRLSAELHHKLKMQALVENVSIQQWIEKIIIKRLEKNIMNDTQNLVSLISGYNPNDVFTSAKDEGYYESTNRLKYLKEVIENYPEEICSVKNGSFKEAFNFLQEVFESENDRFHAFKELKEKQE